jgi:hypothetical protein
MPNNIFYLKPRLVFSHSNSRFGFDPLSLQRQGNFPSVASSGLHATSHFTHQEKPGMEELEPIKKLVLHPEKCVSSTGHHCRIRTRQRQSMCKTMTMLQLLNE